MDLCIFLDHGQWAAWFSLLPSKRVAVGRPCLPNVVYYRNCPLHWLLEKACSTGALSALRLPPSRLRVSLYADDASLFVAPTPHDVATTKEILRVFGSASGLKANVQKSAFLPIACDDIDLASLLQHFPVPLGQFPCNYLGLPLHHNKITRADIQPTIDKMASRLQIWRG